MTKKVIKFLLIALMFQKVGHASTAPCFEVVKNTPSEYSVYLSCDSSEYNLQLSQRFNKDWHIYLANPYYDPNKFNFIITSCLFTFRANDITFLL